VKTVEEEFICARDVLDSLRADQQLTLQKYRVCYFSFTSNSLLGIYPRIKSD
jgi:hypothetical protein